MSALRKNRKHSFAWYRSLELKLKGPYQEFWINGKRTNSPVYLL